MTVEEYFQFEANDPETRYEYLDGHVYAMAAGDHKRQRERHEVQRRLTAIKSIADEFAEHEDYAAALTIYKVLVSEIIAHFNDYRNEYVAFSVILTRCIEDWIPALRVKKTTKRYGCASYESSLPSIASLQKVGWIWMKTSPLC